ncbi:hypothetical protein [Noviluteimonas dokdonensis]|nr:hypothetical protein [Lysobacter dokdonensis]
MTHATRLAMALCTLALAPAALAGNDKCKDIHADMTEIRVTTGCDAGEPSCFLGEVDGNHGFRGTTHFRANSGGTPASGSPEWSPYAGSFRYELRDGTLTMVEAGLTGKGQVLAHHEVVSGTGRYENATGNLFVFGTTGPVVTTQITGTICTQ